MSGRCPLVALKGLQGWSMKVVIFANKPREIKQSGTDGTRMDSLLILDRNGVILCIQVQDRYKVLNLKLLYY